MSLDRRRTAALHAPVERAPSAAALYERMAADLHRAVREERESAPHLSPDQLHDQALRRSIAALGHEISRGTLVYLRWRLEQAAAAVAGTRAESAALRERTAATRSELRAARRTLADAPPERTEGRRFRDAGHREWYVHEVSKADAEWARASHCLLFSSEECIRRVWRYPAAWWRLADAELEALSWRS